MTRPLSAAMRRCKNLAILGLTSLATTRYVITQGVVTMQDPTILILASLADGDKHGYAIMEDIQVFAGIRLGPGTLYGAICRLEQRGWIRAEKSEARRQPYRITAEGRDRKSTRLNSSHGYISYAVF